MLRMGRWRPEVAELLVGSTQGNPLALLEVPRLLSEAQLAGEQPIDEPLPVGPTLMRALLQRQSGLSEPDAPRAARGRRQRRGARAAGVRRALGAAGLDRGVLDSAEEAGVLAIAAERMKFRHPLLRSAIYHGATGPARRAAHAALATVTDGEARVWHLAQATVGEDEAVAAMLERVGLDARRRGAPAAAASALERAARLSKPGEKRAWRLTEAARDAHLAGHSAGAMRLLDDALAGVDDAVAAGRHPARPRADPRAAGPHRERIPAAGRRGARVRDIDPERTAAMLAEACLHCLLGADIAQGARAPRATPSAWPRQPAPASRRSPATMLAGALVMTGERAEAGALLDRFLPCSASPTH